MKRDFLKYAGKGRERRGDHNRYDMHYSEMLTLIEMIHQDGMDGLFNAIRTAYDAGFEAGARMTEKANKKGTLTKRIS